MPEFELLVLDQESEDKNSPITNLVKTDVIKKSLHASSRRSYPRYFSCRLRSIWSHSSINIILTNFIEYSIDKEKRGGKRDGSRRKVENEKVYKKSIFGL